MRRNTRGLALTTIFLIGPCAAYAGLMDMGTLGGSSSGAQAISGDGAVIVGYSQVTGNAATHAFKYAGGSMLDLGTLGGTNSRAFAASNDGGVIVGESYTTGDTAWHAFKYTGGVMTDLGTLGGTNSIANGVSGDGGVIVGRAHLAGDLQHRAFKYVGAVMTSLGTLGGSNSEATAVSADGSVIVGNSLTAGDAADHAFKYVGAAMTDLGTVGGSAAYARAVSADGGVIVGDSTILGDAASHAFKYAGGLMADLGTLGGSDSVAYGVSADGGVIVGDSYLAGDLIQHVFRYSDAVMTDLGTLGGSNSYAGGVSSDGKVIVGYSDITGDLAQHAFIYRTVMVDANNTAAALARNGAQLGAVLNLKNSLLANALDSDCAVYSARGVCLALSGWHYSGRGSDLAAQTASTLKAAYRFGDRFRAGLSLDLAYSQAEPGNFDSGRAPLFGAFAAFGDGVTGLGPQLKVALAYGRADTAITRGVLANTEAGKGDSALKSFGAKAELGYGLAEVRGWKTLPYAALRWSEVSRGGYTETSGATFPVVYGGAALRQFTALAGLRAARSLSAKFGLSAGAGVEQDLRGSIDSYSGAMDTLGSFRLGAPDLAWTRPFADVGLTYALAKDQRLTAGYGARRQALGQRYATLVSAQYSIAF